MRRHSLLDSEPIGPEGDGLLADACIPSRKHSRYHTVASSLRKLGCEDINFLNLGRLGKELGCLFLQRSGNFA